MTFHVLRQSNRLILCRKISYFVMRSSTVVVADCDLPQLGRDSASSRTCCRMQLHAAKKPTNPKFVRVVSKKVQYSIEYKTGKWEAVVANKSIGTCSS